MERFTKYEHTRLLAKRMQELQQNATPRVEVRAGDTLYDIAARELAEGKLDYKVVRHWPGGVTEEINVL